MSVAPKRRAGDALGTLMQVFAIAAMAFILGTILHKGVADISALAQRHSSQDFWPALARYLIGNLAGGASSGADAEKRAP